MTNEIIENIFESLLSSQYNSDIKFYRKFAKDKDFKSLVQTFQDFNWKFIEPFKEFLNGFIIENLGGYNEDILFIFQNSDFIMNNFEKVIQEMEGTTCCTDKACNIINLLIKYYKDKKSTSFDTKAKYMISSTFDTYEKTVEFYKALKSLYYGNPEKYLKELKNIYA